MTKKTAFLLLLILAAIYLFLTFGLPPDPRSLAAFKLTVAKSRLISVTVAAPLLVIWALAFYGFAQFKEYANKIKKSADGKGLNEVANGLMVLAIFSLPVSSILSSSLNYYVRSHPGFKQESTMITSYFSILVYLLAFILIARGAKRLLKITKQAINYSDQLMAVFGFLVISILYSYLTLRNAWSDPATPTSLVHYLSTPVVVLTVLAPYLFIWFSGLVAAARLSLYRLTVAGAIYKRALRNLTAGIGLVVIGSISVQFLSSLGAALLKLSLNKILIIIYALLAVIAAGYVMIALGAKRLKKFEEV